MYKRITALLLVICLLITAAPVVSGAAAQAVSVGTASVYPGNTAAVTLRAENFQNIASLEVYLYYDASALQLSSTYNGSLLSGAQTSVNTAQAGTVKLVTMSLDGINGSGELLTLYFQAAYDCAPGKYPVTVAIGGAYDTMLEEVSVSSTNGSITVLEQVQTTQTFSIYANYNKSTLQKGDTLTCWVANSSYQSFGSADFILEYDREIFAFEAAALDSALTGEGAIYSVNSSVLGQVRITYASVEPVSANGLFRVDLKVIADENTTTQIKAQATNVYRQDLSAYLPGSCAYTFWLEKLPEVIDYPDAFLQTQQLNVGQRSQSVFALEAGAGVAAADFTLNYDPAVLRCVSVTAAEGLAELGGMVIINDNYADGKIRFSYVNMNAYSEGEVPIVKLLWEPLQSPASHYRVTPGGVGVVDAQQGAITLEYVTDSGCIYAPTVTPPTCLEDGCTTFACNACGNFYQVDIVEKLGHDITHHEAKKETCTTAGWKAYESCSRCDYTTYAEIPALGHDEIFHEAQAVTCTGIGWESYVTCRRCDYSTYREIPAQGHRVIGQTQMLVAPVAVENNDAVPFVLSDGVYYSQNHVDSSASYLWIKALYDCTVQLTYGVSSEQNYDQLYIHQNDVLLDSISGSVTDRTLAVYLTVGDVLTVCYSKDGSVNAGQDQGWVKLDYQPVWGTGIGDIPAESAEPTCTEAVVCHYCQTVIKKALGHDTIAHGGKAATCLEAGWEAYETCARCDHTTYVTLPALGHDEIFHEAQVETCTGIGWVSYATCSRCDYSTYEEIPALGHDVIYHEGKEATCLEAGWADYVTCSRCDYTTYREIPALDHDLHLDGPQAPTCTESGWEVSGYCSRCDFMVYVGLPALGHDVIAHDARMATCTESGWEAYEACSRCDYSTYAEIPALGHDAFYHEGKAATCLEAGWADYVTCSRCDYATYEEIPALGHDALYHEGKAATCLEAGWEAYETCSRCDYSTYTEIPALDHDLHLDGPQAPTCTADGWEVNGYCSRCDYSTYREIPALGHGEITHGGKAVSCTEIGWEPYVTCSRCDYTTYREIPALGHDEIYHEGKEATGQENGWEAYVTCSRCDYSTYREIPALGHDLTEHAGKAATCLEAGWADYVTCSRCDYTTYREIPALGHSEITHGGKAAACTEIGWEAYVTCSRCDYSTYKEIPALGHDWTEKFEDAAHLRTKAANCTQVHTYWYGCSRCAGLSDTAYFDGTTPGPHSFTEEIRDDAHRVPGTEDPALYYYDCAWCDAIGTETFSDVLKGDLDGDGDVDEDDAIYLLQHVLMPALFPKNQPMDYDKNGTVNEDDAIYLLQHVLMPGLFPL